MPKIYILWVHFKSLDLGDTTYALEEQIKKTNVYPVCIVIGVGVHRRVNVM